ncbi:MAG: hypothetical protein KAR16_11460 [Bacteroidales bacterium]|nr:hypothetical protein [Bacteroidales bacterium]
MKHIYMIVAGLLCLSLASAQLRSVGLVAGAGYTAVDIEDAVDWSPLEEWDNFGIIIKAVVEYELKPGLLLVGEVGENRLYYWEYRWSDGYYSGTRYRSEWTTNIGLSFKKLLNKSLYIQAGPGVHIFNDGSGTVLGLLLGAGYEMEVGDRFVVPLGFRVEPVFGNAVPISLLLHTGIRYIL